MNISTVVRKKAPHSIMSWSWVIIISFFALSFLDIRFALAGFLCMLAPIGFAVAGKGKVHCSHYCPRGSFYGKFLDVVSMKKTMPKFMSTKAFKNVLLLFIMVNFSLCMARVGWGYENIGGGVFRMFLRTFAIGLVMGIVFMPRSWCKVCPMGYAAGIIRDFKTKPAGKKQAA